MAFVNRNSTENQLNYSICDVVTAVPKLECESLVALFENTNGYSWVNKTNWLITTAISDWYGVTVTDGHVTHISVYNNKLEGTIPVGLGNLTELINLDLSSNLLTGSIPSDIGNLSNLTALSLFQNNITGSIPAELGKLSKLQLLLIDTTQLSGNVPTSIGNLVNLILLSLRNTNLSGSLPLTFTNLTSVVAFYFYDTQLCEPETPEFLAWKASVADFRSTGVVCPVYDMYMPCVAE